MFKILKKEILNQSTTKMTLDAPNIANSAKAGQFVIIRVDEKGERIPLTISNYEKDSETIDIIFQKAGKTTLKLDSKKQGDTILDVVGPLGKPSDLSKYKKAIIVGGGTGCAIAYPQAKVLYSNGCEVHIIAGFRNKDAVILENEMKSVSHSLDILTDDGSYGNKGLVTDKLSNKILNNKDFDLVIAVGPIPMMKAVSSITKPFNIKTVVSMNPLMIDGTGMCGGCRITVNGKTKFACIDGPDFDGHKVDFDEIILRNKTYTDFEKDTKKGICKLLKECK